MRVVLYPGGMSLALHDDLLIEIAVMRKLAQHYARQIVDIDSEWGFDTLVGRDRKETILIVLLIIVMMVLVSLIVGHWFGIV